MTDVNAAFEELLHGRLIPEFCAHSKRGCEPNGFRFVSGQVAEEDARYFVMAYEAGLIEHKRNGLYRGATSSASEQFFWEGLKSERPRRFWLWLEPIITVAGLARLHFDYGWPKEFIGTQSSDWAFDLVAFLPGSGIEFIAGEVKKTKREIEQLIQLMQDFGKDPFREEPPSGKQRNAFKKIVGLRSRKPPLFWALGPAGVSHVFNVSYGAGEVIELLPASHDALTYRNGTTGEKKA